MRFVCNDSEAASIDRSRFTFIMLPSRISLSSLSLYFANFALHDPTSGMFRIYTHFLYTTKIIAAISQTAIKCGKCRDTVALTVNKAVRKIATISTAYSLRCGADGI